MSSPRWLPVLVLAASIAFAALGTRDAGAQVFRPRTGKAAVIAKAAPASAASASPGATATSGKKAPVAEAPAPKAPRAAATTRRPAAGKKKHGKRGTSDDVKIDDDDEDVKITDD
jgi:hypothetical protein